jgi:cob(I)alamin adenosyltransferase
VERRGTQIYTGNGRGKTSAAVGLSVRALGHGWKVRMIQFLKPPGGSGETDACRRLPGFEASQHGDSRFVQPGDVRSEDVRLAESGMRTAESAVRGGEWDLVVLDEIFPAVSLGLVGLDRVERLVREKPDTVELVLTGRNAPAELEAAADLVSRIEEVKHPFQRGIPARRGVDF